MSAFTPVHQSRTSPQRGRGQRAAELLDGQRRAHRAEGQPVGERPAAQRAEDDRGAEDVAGAGRVDRGHPQRGHLRLLPGRRVDRHRAVHAVGDDRERNPIGERRTAPRAGWSAGCRPSPRSAFGMNASHAASWSRVAGTSSRCRPSRRRRTPALRPRWPRSTHVGVPCRTVSASGLQVEQHGVGPGRAADHLGRGHRRRGGRGSPCCGRRRPRSRR